MGNDWCAVQLAEYKEFKERYSPIGLWSHRFPKTSPLVPLLFQYHYPEHRRKQNVPFGYWYGDPIHTLIQLAGAVCLFENYWTSLPNGIGAPNIKYKLSEAEQFSGFLFELLVAIDSKLYKYRDCQVEPLFFDPRTVEGGADIFIRKGDNEIAIQCKTRSPLSALAMSFDIFQYIFGRFYKLVQDTGHSYKFTMNLNDKFELGDIDDLLTLLNSAIKSGLQIPMHSGDPLYQVELSRLDVPINGISESDIKRLLSRDRANLFCEIGGFNAAQGDATRFNRIAICSVSARQAESLEESVIRIVRQAASETQVSCPLTLAIHFYGQFRFEDYLRNPTNRSRLRRRIDATLKSYPRVKSVNVSSNRQEYASLPSGAQLIRTQYLEIQSRYFEA